MVHFSPYYSGVSLLNQNIAKKGALINSTGEPGGRAWRCLRGKVCGVFSTLGSRAGNLRNQDYS